MKENHLERLMRRFPAVSDLRERAGWRIPHVAWEYLESGCGDETAVARNLEKMAAVTLVPRFLKGELVPDISTTLFGQTYQAPFGVAPMGLTGLIWPRSEFILARTAAKYSIPYCLSTVATQTPETVGPLVGDMGWFQLYPPRDPKTRDDLLKRAWDSGFKTMVVTADVPVGGQRDRSIRAGFGRPERFTLRNVCEAMKHPTWTINTLRIGLPKLKTLEKYTNSTSTGSVLSYVSQSLGGTLSWDYLAEVREAWEGPLVLKGIVHPEDAELAVQTGVDGIYVSNHGARQLNAVPAAIESLPEIVRRVQGRAGIIFDSGVRSGLDVVRAIALGADIVLLGRAFLYGVAALGDHGGDHVVEILLADMKNVMVQLGCASLQELQELARG